jgi:hypothetical protein
MLAKQIGENIKSVRLAKADGKGWPLEKVAARVRPPTSYQQVSRLEKGKMLTIEWIERLARALDVDPMELIAPERTKPAPGFHLDERVANEAARTLAAAALGEQPDTGTVEAVALVLQELTAMFSTYPEAAADVRVARPAIDQLTQRFVPVAS